MIDRQYSAYAESRLVIPTKPDKIRCAYCGDYHPESEIEFLKNGNICEPCMGQELEEMGDAFTIGEYEQMREKIK